MLRVGLGAGLHFVLLEQLKGLLSQTSPEGRQQLTATGAALSGGAFWLACLRVSRRFQTNTGGFSYAAIPICWHTSIMAMAQL